MVKEAYPTGTLLIDIFVSNQGIYLGLTDSKLYHLVFNFKTKEIVDYLDFSFKAIWRKA